MPGCGGKAKLVPPPVPPERKVGAGPVELIIRPSTMKEEGVERKPPFKEVPRVFFVKCPVHGIQHIYEVGHHISTIPKKPAKKS